FLYNLIKMEESSSKQELFTHIPRLYEDKIYARVRGCLFLVAQSAVVHYILNNSIIFTAARRPFERFYLIGPNLYKIYPFSPVDIQGMMETLPQPFFFFFAFLRL
ncbi:hypothetical protein ACJX0J_016064, partial [Zea mays]